MLTHPTLDRLNALGLTGMAKAFNELTASGEADRLSHACAFRRIRSAVPTTSGQSFRGIRSAEDLCRVGMVLMSGVVAFVNVFDGFT